MTTKATLAATAAACLIVGSIGGYSIAKITSPKSGFNRQGGFASNGQGQRGQMVGSGRVMGEVQSLADGRMIIKTQNNNSQIVIIGSTTKYQKMADASSGDIAVGNQVQVVGTKNSDGSTTATSIQIVPAGSRPSGAPANANNNQDTAPNTAK